MRIAAQSARFKAGYTSMAYSPDAGASWHLPRLIGSEQAKRLLFLDELWSADRALAAGLVGEVVADEQLHAHTTALATPADATTQHVDFKIGDGIRLGLAHGASAQQAFFRCGRCDRSWCRV